MYSTVFAYSWGVAAPVWFASGLTFQIALMAVLGTYKLDTTDGKLQPLTICPAHCRDRCETQSAICPYQHGICAHSIWQCWTHGLYLSKSH